MNKSGKNARTTTSTLPGRAYSALDETRTSPFMSKVNGLHKALAETHYGSGAHEPSQKQNQSFTRNLR
jgi:hypothetical protein